MTTTTDVDAILKQGQLTGLDEINHAINQAKALATTVDRSASFIAVEGEEIATIENFLKVLPGLIGKIRERSVNTRYALVAIRDDRQASSE